MFIKQFSSPYHGFVFQLELGAWLKDNIGSHSVHFTINHPDSTLGRFQDVKLDDWELFGRGFEIFTDGAPYDDHLSYKRGDGWAWYSESPSQTGYPKSITYYVKIDDPLLELQCKLACG
jgi:hypothetical protein